MAKIITVTANTAIDLMIEIDGLSILDNLKAKNSAEYACGKGINVAKAVESLNHSVLCLGFAGRQSMPLYDGLNSKRLKTDLIAIDGRTRTNLTLSDRRDQKETHIRTSGFHVSPDDCARLEEKLKSHVETRDIVVFSGSLPPGAPNDWYGTLIELCRRKNAIPILDTSGNPLIESLKAKPYLIKPNQQELEEITGKTLPDEHAIAAAAHVLLDLGIEWVFVSRGSQGVVAVSRETALSASADIEPEAIQSHIGCGDAMVAGLAVATLEKQGPEQTIKLGVACGAANLYSKEPGRLDPERLPKLSDQIEISPLSDVRARPGCQSSS